MPYQLLFADDSATMHRVLQITFAREDFTIIGVNNGAAAIAKAKEVKPDVAVIDISMPGMDGYAVCHSLKSDPATAQIPVLLLAGSQEPFDEARAQASGANSHVVKP
ncbi:MAG TPA: response regulator, partial [Myxococcota bacterium]|nr:response regulator [Myxococcota bacterium]